MVKANRFVYKIKRFFFPHEHDQEVILIHTYQNYVRRIQHELAKQDKLMEYGYMGDTLWETREDLYRSLAYCKNKINELKARWADNYQGRA